MKKINGKIFVDRDAKIFQEVLNYLRNDMQSLPEFGSSGNVRRKDFEAELTFWGLDEKFKISKGISDTMKSYATEKGP